MVNIDELIEIFNRVFTDSSNEDVNLKECISLYDIVNAYNNMYQAFKKEYNELKKITLGLKNERIEFNYFERSNEQSERDWRYLCFKISGQRENSWDLFFCEEDGEISVFKCHSGSFVRKYLPYNKAVVKKYLDLFQKYEFLLEFHELLQKNKLDTGRFILSITGSYFLDTKALRVWIVDCILFMVNAINIIVDLNNELSFNLDDCWTYYDDQITTEKHPLSKEDIIKILKGININGRLLECLENDSTLNPKSRKESKVKMLKDNLK